jgi:hypothetical protein
MCRLSRNSGASTSRNPKGLSRPVTGTLYLYLYIISVYITAHNLRPPSSPHTISYAWHVVVVVAVVAAAAAANYWKIKFGAMFL